MLVEVTGSIASRLQYCLVSDCKWIIDNKNQIQSKEDKDMPLTSSSPTILWKAGNPWVSGPRWTTL